MQILASIIALVIMIVVLVDAFEALVLPRRAMRKYRPARIFYRVAWRTWRRTADRLLRGAMRQHFLSWFRPFSLLTLFASWAFGLIVAFALLHWALSTPLGSAQVPPSFAVVQLVATPIRLAIVGRQMPVDRDLPFVSPPAPRQGTRQGLVQAPFQHRKRFGQAFFQGGHHRLIRGRAGQVAARRRDRDRAGRRPQQYIEHHRRCTFPAVGPHQLCLH